MLKTLVKKQMTELFRSYFVNPKTHEARSQKKTALLIFLFVCLLTVALGGAFFALSMGLSSLVKANVGWLYWLVMIAIGIVLGVFGSVFNTFSGLYLAKDNDALFCLPIPVKYILLSRLITVFLMGLIYSSVVIVPAGIVYNIYSPGVKAVAGTLVTLLTVSLFVLVLSCILGWCVAKLSSKLKNKSFITVLISLLFIVAYYLVYFKFANDVPQLAANLMLYGDKIKGKAYVVYMICRSAEGEILPMLFVIAAVFLLAALTYIRLNTGFIKLATASSAVSGEKKKNKIKSQSVFGSLFSKEMGRFTSSANYMLNCGLGTLFLPAAAVLFIVKYKDLAPHLAAMGLESKLAVLGTAVIIMLSSINDPSSASISLEGKSLWIVQSLPVSPTLVFDAKILVQLVITLPGVLLLAFSEIFLLGLNFAESLGILLCSLLMTVMLPHAELLINLLRPSLDWTNELYPIKQSLPVAVALFGTWLLSIAVGGLYFLVAKYISAAVYLYLWAAIALGIIILIRRYLTTKGAKFFSVL